MPFTSVQRRGRTSSESATDGKWGRSSFHADPNKDSSASTTDVETSSSSSNPPPAPLDAVQNHEGVQPTSSKQWGKMGKLSDRASEILEDARLSKHGKEKNLYDTSLQRLSQANDVSLLTLGERVSIGRSSGPPTVSVPVKDKTAEEGQEEEEVEEASQEDTSLLADLDAAYEMIDRASLVEIRSISYSVSWQGNLFKRSEWLRRWEKSYFVLDGVDLKRYASQEAFQESLHHSPRPQVADMSQLGTTPPRRSSSSSSTLSHGSVSGGVQAEYTVSGIKNSTSSRNHGFVICTEEGKSLNVTASSEIEKVVWMRLILEAIYRSASKPDLKLQPLDVEEFYAMLVVLYTIHSDDWRVDGDMAVTLPPPSDLIFCRFFSLLDEDVLITSNYPPAVPFCGTFRGHAGLITYVDTFSRHTKWTKFKIEGMNVGGMIAVASGREELENRRDGRKFIQNWVHKLNFSMNGSISRIELNGDVVAASAVYKVPGAATTLRLPTEFKELEATKVYEGSFSIHVIQAQDLRIVQASSNTSVGNISSSSSSSRKVKNPSVQIQLDTALDDEHTGRGGSSAATGHQKLKKSTSVKSSNHASSGGVGTKLTRKISAASILMRSSSNAVSASSSSNTGMSANGYLRGTSGNARDDFKSQEMLSVIDTGVPKRYLNPEIDPSSEINNIHSQEPQPVWDALIECPFSDVRRTCWIRLDVRDKFHQSVGFCRINMASFILKDGGDNATEPTWYTVSNVRGEFCGKVLLGISCRTDAQEDLQGTSVGSSDGTVKSPNSTFSQMNKWRQRSLSINNPEMFPSSRRRAATSAAGDPHDAHSALSSHDEEDSAPVVTRSRGWSNVVLSPKKKMDQPLSAGHATVPDVPLHDGHEDGHPSRGIIRASATTHKQKTSAELEECHTFTVCGSPFVIPSKYNLIKVCGKGAYGVVIAATDSKSRGNVAIKKVIDCIWHPHQVKQVLREVRLIRHFKHENVLSLMDLLPPPSYTDFRDVYMVIDLMEMDLHRIIYSKEILSDDHIRYFLYQILSALHHIHQAGVLHRDLKPSNLLINSDCQLKICDFGLARKKDLEDAGMTEYVVTRWYRAPELLLGSAYDEGVDLWAAGCIFAEMLGRKPLFPGRSYHNQLALIMNVLGVPEEHAFKENPMASKLKGRELLSQSQSTAGLDLSTIFPLANPEGVDLLWKILVFDKTKRISVEEALRHPYLASFYEEEKLKQETSQVEVFDSFDFDDLSSSDLKELMFKEICHFHPEQMELRAIQLENMPEEEELPPGWIKRESRSNPGKIYYTHPKKGLSTWEKPTE